MIVPLLVDLPDEAAKRVSAGAELRGGNLIVRNGDQCEIATFKDARYLNADTLQLVGVSLFALRLARVR